MLSFFWENHIKLPPLTWPTTKYSDIMNIKFPINEWIFIIDIILMQNLDDA